MKANIDTTHEIRDKESHLYHVKLTSRENNAATKEYENKVSIQKFTVSDFQQMEKNKYLSLNYWKVEILHNPEIKEVKAKLPAAPAKDIEDGKGAKIEPIKLSKKKEKELLADLQMQYKEKYNEDADSSASIADLQELLN